MSKPLLSIICAMDKNRLIGRNNQLPWHLPADLAFFRRNTIGKPVIMGRNTFESIGKPLPGRQNIVVTSNPQWQSAGCDVADSVDEAVSLAASATEIMLIGGASLYEQTIDIADKLYLTLIDHAFEGDTWFPDFSSEQWLIDEKVENLPDEYNHYSFAFVNFIRDK